MKPQSRRIQPGENPVDFDAQAEFNKRKCDRIRPVLIALLSEIGLEDNYCKSISSVLTFSELKALIKALSNKAPEVAERTALEILMSED